MPCFDINNIKNEYESYSHEKNSILQKIKRIVINSKAPLEGNAFYLHKTLQIYPELYLKQLNLFWCGKQATTRICEIGFNAGHSTMIMLLGREKTPLNFTIFDIGHHPYTNPCLKFIQTKFQHVNFEYIKGDSTITMPKWIEKNNELIGMYDVVHIDGGHSEHCIYNDIKNTNLLLRVNGFIIIDDTNMKHINKYVDMYIESGKYKEVDIIKTVGYPHRILQKIE